MRQVYFTAPVSAADLRVVLANTTAKAHDYFAVVYRTQYGETREIPWLTEDEANRRAVALRNRGYRAVAGRMD